MHHCLAIDTSSTYLGLGLMGFSQTNDRIHVLGKIFQKKPLRQSDLMIPALASLLKKKKLTARDLELVVVNVGPGSFTGVRVGVSTARALAQGLELPLVSVSGLEAMAFQAGPGVERKDATIVPVIPASAEEVYFAGYKWFGYTKRSYPLKEVMAPQWNKVQEFKAFLKKGIFKKKNGSHHLVSSERDNLNKGEEYQVPRPESIGILGIRRFLSTSDKKKFHFKYTVPLYLQPSWAERKKK